MILRDGRLPHTLTGRCHAVDLRVYDRMLPYLAQMGFLGVSLIGNCRVDIGYMTAMVERWRPETHTFYLPHGEMTVTLEDVARLLGLPTRGLPVTGNRVRSSLEDIPILLGFPATDRTFNGNGISLLWLRDSLGAVTCYFVKLLSFNFKFYLTDLNILMSIYVTLTFRW